MTATMTNIQIGTLIAITNKVNHGSCSGTFQGFKDGRLVLHTTKGNTRTFNIDSHLWLVRTTVKNLI